MFDSLVSLFQQDPKMAAIIAVCCVVFYAIEKLVHLSPSKKDDIVLDCLVCGIKKVLMPQKPGEKSKLPLFLVGIGLSGLLMGGCSALTTADSSYTWPDECYTDGTLNSDAVIPSLITSPSTTSLTLRLANTAAITAGYYTADQAVAVINKAISALETDTTFATFAAYVTNLVKTENSTVEGCTIFVTTAALFLDNTATIDDCDKAIILLHLKKELAVAEALETTGDN